MREKEPFKIDKNGTKYFYDWTCDRCGGKGGADVWRFTGYRCYKCGGTGKMDKPDIIKVYTPEYQAKLDAKAKERAAERQAKLEAEAEAKKPEFMEKNGFTDENGEWVTYRAVGYTFPIKDELKAAGYKFNRELGWHGTKPVNFCETQRMTFDEVAEEMNVWGNITYKDGIDKLFIENIKKAEERDAINKTSEWKYQVGETAFVTGKIHKLWEGESQYGYYNRETIYLYKIDGDDGNIYITKTSHYFEPESVVTVAGVVKELKERDGVKQTVLTRIKEKK